VDEGGGSVTIELPELESSGEVDLQMCVSCDGGKNFSAPCPYLVQVDERMRVFVGERGSDQERVCVCVCVCVCVSSDGGNYFQCVLSLSCPGG